MLESGIEQQMDIQFAAVDAKTEQRQEDEAERHQDKIKEEQLDNRLRRADERDGLLQLQFVSVWEGR